MKTHQLILLTTVLFITLFYGEDLGLNFGILGISYALLLWYQTPIANRSRTFYALLALAIFSSTAFAYYGDFPSFFSIIMTTFLLAFKSKNKQLKSILVIPLFAVNFVTFIYRFFKMEDWLPKSNTSGSVQKLIAVVLIPAVFVLLFFGVYALGSSHFSGLFKNYEFDLNFWEFFALSCVGFFIAFNVWNFKIENFFFSWNDSLINDFNAPQKTDTPTFQFLDINSERKSGVISFFALNVLLLVFIVTFNYEQFIEIPKSPTQLSAETHERVNAVILAIVMAILVVMFYFKGTFNFDQHAKPMKILAKIWLCLNAVLVISAFLKNSEYILNFGLTYKRMGVYAFLVLSFIGLIFTWIKIHKQKTNAYLFNTMIWFFYGTVLAASFINWGNLATVYNIQNHKGNFSFHESMNFNDKILLQKYPAQMQKSHKSAQIKKEKDKTYLSGILYYLTLK